MNWINSFLEGAMSGLGMWLMMTIMGALTYFALKKRITLWLATLWSNIKKEAVKLDGVTIEGKIKTKKEKKRSQ